jgi:hypothetical protein
MTFDEILAQVLALLQRQKRVSYRALTETGHGAILRPCRFHRSGHAHWA